MTVEMTLEEAKLLIAVLLYAESSAQVLDNDAMTLAIRDLRHWRTALLVAYLRHASAPATNAVGQRTDNPI